MCVSEHTHPDYLGRDRFSESGSGSNLEQQEILHSKDSDKILLRFWDAMMSKSSENSNYMHAYASVDAPVVRKRSR